MSYLVHLISAHQHTRSTYTLGAAQNLEHASPALFPLTVDEAEQLSALGKHLRFVFLAGNELNRLG